MKSYVEAEYEMMSYYCNPTPVALPVSCRLPQSPLRRGPGGLSRRAVRAAAAQPLPPGRAFNQRAETLSPPAM